MIKLGSKVKDTITGFTGIAVGRTEWMNGCARIGIQPKKLKDGKPVEVEWFDEQQIEVIKEKKPEVSPHCSATSGGPQHDPSPRACPRR